MATKILTNDKRRTLANDKRTTLSSVYVCDVCGEPAMTREQGRGRVRLRCPSCWLREQGRKIIPLDHSGYRP